MKKYIIYTLKRYLPFFITSSAIIFSIFIIVVGNYSATVTTYNYGENPYYSGSGLLLFIIPLALLTTIAPIFANTYRYSLKRADFYYQIGKGEKTIRWINNLVMLIALLAIYTAIYLTALLIFFLKQFSEYGDYVAVSGMRQDYVLHNFGLHIVAYLVAVIGCIINYAISYYLITRSNNGLNSMMTLILGHGLLTFLFITPFFYINTIESMLVVDETFNFNFLGGTRLPSIIGWYVWVYRLFELPITNRPVSITFTNDDIFLLILSILSVLIFIGAGAYSIYKFLTEKESSGELAGKPEGRSRMQNIIFHSGAGLLGFWQATGYGFGTTIIGLNVLTNIASLIMFGGVYFAFTGLYRRSFKFKKKDWIIYISVVFVYIVALITSIIMQAIGRQNSIQ